MPTIRFATEGANHEQIAEVFAEIVKEAESGRKFLVMEMEREPKPRQRKEPEPKAESDTNPTKLVKSSVEVETPSEPDTMQGCGASPPQMVACNIQPDTPARVAPGIRLPTLERCHRGKPLRPHGSMAITWNPNEVGR